MDGGEAPCELSLLLLSPINDWGLGAENEVRPEKNRSLRKGEGFSRRDIDLIVHFCVILTRNDWGYLFVRLLKSERQL